MAEPTVVTEDGWTLSAGCTTTCRVGHVSGEEYYSGGPVIASPEGSTYSVHHMVGADLDGAGPQGITCVRIFDPNSQLDDIVAFDELPEALRPDILGTTATVEELHTIQQSGSRFIEISTSSPAGTDLFPAGQTSGGETLPDACFAIGLDDPLDWQGLDVVTLAVIRFTKDGNTILGPSEITELFSDPWNGVMNITVPGAAGLGINGVVLSIQVDKVLPVPNNDCEGATIVGNGSTAFSNDGATTDGDDHQICAFGGVTGIGSDVWFQYTATCTGDLTVDLCNSNFDTKVAVYNCDRCPLEDDPIACNDDFCSLRSYIGPLPVTAGNCYLIRVGGYLGAQGSGVMTITCNKPTEIGACCVDGACVQNTTQPDCLSLDGEWHEGQTCPGFVCPGSIPSNDECDNAIRVFTGVPFESTTVNSTGTDITSCTSNDSKDVWHFWTADCTGRVQIETCGPAQFTMDTSLAIFDSCGGAQLACADDGCNVRSVIPNLSVVQGQTYYIRVAAFSGAVGAYRLLVNPCRNACCTPTGQCGLVTAQTCVENNGVPQNPGTICLGDQDVPPDGIDEVCEACPVGVNLVNADPPSGTVDARQPHPHGSQLPRQGLGSPGGVGVTREAIRLLVIPRLSGLENCFALCETIEDPLEGPNTITSVVYQGNGIYEIVLDHAIAAGGVTTIEYVGSNTFAQYTAHPVNSNANFQSDWLDVIRVESTARSLIDCCVSGLCTPLYGDRSCDLDHSTRRTPLDILTAIDLLNGAHEWQPWNNTPKPTNTSCPE